MDPHCFSQVADILSKMVDFCAKLVLSACNGNFWFDQIFTEMRILGVQNENSLTSLLTVLGSNSFSNHYGGKDRNWSFPTIRLIMKTVSHLQK
jgi:hypothetical protein